MFLLAWLGSIAVRWRLIMPNIAVNGDYENEIEVGSWNAEI